MRRRKHSDVDMSPNSPEPSRPCAEPVGFSLLRFKTILGYQWKTLVQVEALTKDALFQHAFHSLSPGNLDLQFCQFLLSQCAPAHTQRRVLIEAGDKRLDFGHRKACISGKLDESQLLKDPPGITAVSMSPLGPWQDSNLFIITNGRCPQPCLVRNFANGQFWFVHCGSFPPLDFKCT